jgi:hypothetical protein
MAEVLVSRRLFEEILERIHRLKPAGNGRVAQIRNPNIDPDALASRLYVGVHRD